MTKSKIINTKKLSFREDPYSQKNLKYFTNKDVLFVDFSKVYYGENDKEFYKAKDIHGHEGYVIKSGVTPI